MLSERLELKIQESCINKIYLAMVVLIAEDTTSGMFYLTKWGQLHESYHIIGLGEKLNFQRDYSRWDSF